jgi:hypothetical protein
MALVLALAAFAAAGAADVAAGTFEQSDFVLAAKPRRVSAPVPTAQQPPAKAVDQTLQAKGPSWTYRPRAGAVLEVAAMGGVIAEAPRLAHIAFNWKF